MNSLGEMCIQAKRDYDACFQTWFAEHFLKGDTNDSKCATLFKNYQQCLKKAMKEQNIELKDIEVSHLDTENEQKPPS